MSGDRVSEAVDACLTILGVLAAPVGLVEEDDGAEALRTLEVLDLDEWSVRLVWQGIAVNLLRGWADDTGQTYVDVMAKLRTGFPPDVTGP